MNEIRQYFYQITKEDVLGRAMVFNWEVMVALGDDGYYYGRIAGGTLSTNFPYPWSSTNETNLEPALEHLKTVCDSLSVV